MQKPSDRAAFVVMARITSTLITSCLGTVQKISVTGTLYKCSDAVGGHLYKSLSCIISEGFLNIRFF